MLSETKKLIEGPQPITTLEIKRKMTMESKDFRDTSLRNRYINALGLNEHFGDNGGQKMEDFLKPYDLGHLQELQHGGSNDFENLIFEDKCENRAPGKKRQIEQKNDDMLLSGKIVYNTYDLIFDKRLPIPVPCKYSITQDVFFRNGRLYESNTYNMSNKPYIAVATNIEVRPLLLKYDSKQGCMEVSSSFIKAGICKTLSTKESGMNMVKSVFKTSIKTAAPYVGKTLIKQGLDIAQTSNHLSPKVKKICAMVSSNTTFNTVLNNITDGTSLYILVNELNKN